MALTELDITPQGRQADAYTWSAYYLHSAASGGGQENGEEGFASAAPTIGEVISEFDRPEGRGWAEVDPSRVERLVLSESMTGAPRYVAQVPAGAHPIFLRRRFLVLDPATGAQMGAQTAHCIGWREASGGPQGERGCFLFAFEDGSALLSESFQAI